MTRSDLDWSYIRRYTTRPLVSAGIAVAVLGIAIWMHGSHKQLFRELSENQLIVHRDYAALVDQRRVIDRYHRRYQRFRELGFIGRESRLDWVETLRTTSAGLDLPRLGYSIEPQRSVVAPVSTLLGGESIDIRVSKLKLEIGLLHEVDLLRFFDALQDQAPGLIKVDKCELSNNSVDSGGRATANLSAACEVQVFSVITSDVTGESL